MPFMGYTASAQGHAPSPPLSDRFDGFTTRQPKPQPTKTEFVVVFGGVGLFSDLFSRVLGMS